MDNRIDAALSAADRTAILAALDDVRVLVQPFEERSPLADLPANAAQAGSMVGLGSLRGYGG